MLQRLFLALWLSGALAKVTISILPVLLGFGGRRIFSIIGVDKVVHFVGFGILGVLTPLAFRSQKGRVFGVLALTCLSLFTEFGQMLLPWRVFSLADMSADFLGLGVGAILGVHAAERLYKRLEKPD